MSDNNNSGSNRNNNRDASAKANAGAGKNAAEKAAENAAAKAKRRTRKQKLINELTRLRKIRNTGQKYRGKKGINATIKNFENALNAEEAKLRNAARKKEEAEAAAKKAAAERAEAKKARNSERRGRSASRSSVGVRSASTARMFTKAEIESLSKNQILAKVASIVNAAKAAAVVSTGVKAAKAEAKEIVKAAKDRYEACKASCKVPYDEEYARAKAIVARAEGE
jgi:hypothetical protein